MSNPDPIIVKNLVKKELEYLDLVAQDIIVNGGSEEVQLYISQNRQFGIEIESPLESIGGTSACWIRLQYDGIWIFLNGNEEKWEQGDDFELNGKNEYQVDYRSEYGGELLVTDSKESLMKAIDEIEAEKIFETMDVPENINYNKQFMKDIAYIEKKIGNYVPYVEYKEKMREEDERDER